MRRRWAGRRGAALAAGLATVTLAAAGCGAGRSVTGGAVTTTGAAGSSGAANESCDGFPMPNPARTGLPNPASYTDNGDGTVTDQVTRLTWEATVDPDERMEDEALGRCAAKGDGWRLPTRLELLSLVDYTIAAPGPTINPIFKDTPGAVFWTSSPYVGDVGDAWNIGFDVGYSDYGLIDGLDHVRCVRPPGARCRPARFVVQPGDHVLDAATGLTWQRHVDPGSYTWGDAQAFCARQGAGWRVPSLTELQTIIDDTKEYPAIDETVFPDTPKVDFWTSSPHADGMGSAWYVDFFYGASDRDVPTRLYQVRCVR